MADKAEQLVGAGDKLQHPERHVIAMLLENQPGALSRVVGLFSQRGYNIESLNVAPTNDETLSRLTLVTVALRPVLNQIIKHLYALVDVARVVDLAESNFLEYELMLVKLHADNEEQHDQIKRQVKIFSAQVVELQAAFYTVRLVGKSTQLDAFLDAVSDIGLLEVARSGALGILSGADMLKLETIADHSE